MSVTELHAAQPSVVATDMTPGRLLAAAREEQRLTVADVANRLKLSVSQVEALENDAYEQLPGPVFVRGFLRNYARLLKLDSEQIVQAMEVPAAPAASPETLAEQIEVPLKSGRRWPRYAVLVALVFATAAAVDVLWPEADTRVTRTEAPAPARVAEAVPASVQPASTQTLGDGGVVGARENAVTAAPAADIAPQASVTRPFSPALQNAPPQSAPPVAASPARLRLLFKERSWVEIRDRNGRVILSKLNAPGTTQELNGAAPLKLVIGNARGVHVIYNERPVDLTRHIRVDVARLTLE